MILTRDHFAQRNGELLFVEIQTIRVIAVSATHQKHWGEADLSDVASLSFVFICLFLLVLQHVGSGWEWWVEKQARMENCSPALFGLCQVRKSDCIQAHTQNSDRQQKFATLKNTLIGNLINIFIMSHSTRCCCVCIVHPFLRRASREERIATRWQDNWMVWSVAHRQELRRSLFDHVDVRRWEINRWKF